MCFLNKLSNFREWPFLFTFLPAMCERSSFPASSLAFGIVTIFIVIVLLLGSLHILNISPLLNTWLLNIVSHSATWLFISERDSYCAKYFKFDEVQFVSFSFKGHAFDVKSKNSLPSSVSWKLSSVFCPKCFIVLCFTFKFVIYFDLHSNLLW